MTSHRRRYDIFDVMSLLGNLRRDLKKSFADLSHTHTLKYVRAYVRNQLMVQIKPYIYMHHQNVHNLLLFLILKTFLIVLILILCNRHLVLALKTLSYFSYLHSCDCVLSSFLCLCLCVEKCICVLRNVFVC